MPSIQPGARSDTWSPPSPAVISLAVRLRGSAAEDTRQQPRIRPGRDTFDVTTAPGCPSKWYDGQRSADATERQQS